jgi:hypothetical protein
MMTKNAKQRVRFNDAKNGEVRLRFRRYEVRKGGQEKGGQGNRW